MLNDIWEGHKLTSLRNVVSAFISLYKAQNTSEEGFEQLYRRLSTSDYSTSRTRRLLAICKDAYTYYTHRLQNENKIDFDDMITQSVDLLDRTELFKYKYIIVDEFQDISQSRVRFLKKLIQHGNSKLFAVGDDWQAIYRFSGSDINIFLKFENYFPGAKINFITSTHRNSDELQRILEPFITANPSQFKKHIRSEKHQLQPVRIVYYQDNKPEALSKALQDIHTIQQDANVLILGRNRYDINGYCNEQVTTYSNPHSGTTVRHALYPTLTLTYQTVHSAKGIECDFVVLVSGEDALDGFPNKMEDDDVLSLVLGEKDAYQYAEERRLFYVALTRTKSITYLLVNKKHPSSFVREIENKCMILADCIEESDAARYCPACKSGMLILRTGKNGDFYGCSHFPYCRYSNNDIEAVLGNHRCPQCGDYLGVRNFQTGKYWVCCNSACRYLQPYTNVL